MLGLREEKFERSGEKSQAPFGRSKVTLKPRSSSFTHAVFYVRRDFAYDALRITHDVSTTWHATAHKVHGRNNSHAS